MQKTVAIFFKEVDPAEAMTQASSLHREMQTVVMPIDQTAHFSVPTALGMTHVTATEAAIEALRKAGLAGIEDILEMPSEE